MSVIDDAEKIVSILAETDTDDRGLLLKRVADRLRGLNQHFTSSCIEMAAIRYGYKE